MARSFIFTLLFTLSLSTVFAARTTEFYIVAHPDDWQLFMGLDAYKAMNDSNKKVVIIHTTAGDASFNAPSPDRKFYIARERGAIASLEFCMDIEHYHTQEYLDTVNINNHMIRKFEYKNVVDYFLRLPDGCGSTGLHGESIAYLAGNSIKHITAVDSSTTYNSWKDLTNTIRTIMETEAAGSTYTGLNVPDTSTLYNPGDHPDHVYTARAALIASSMIDNMWKHFYVDYHVEHMPVNLTQQEVALKAAIYGVAEYARAQNATSNSWCQGHIEFLCHSYYRTVTSKIEQVLHGTGAQNQPFLYPNPASEAVNVIYHLAQAGTVSISVSNVNGVGMISPVILQQQPGDYSTRINVAGLVPGIYIALLETPFYRQTFRFVKI